MAEIAIMGCDPSLAHPSSGDTPQSVTLRMTIVEKGEQGNQRTGKVALVGMTTQDAMRLLVLLQRLQSQWRLELPSEPATYVQVPAKKERH